MATPISDDARDVMELAVCESERFNHSYIGPEHILLGITKGSGPARVILKKLNVGLLELRLEVEKFVDSGTETVFTGLYPTPLAKEILEYAAEEAEVLNAPQVGSHHILLGLLREPNGIAFRILTELGVKIEDVRKQIQILAPEKGAGS